MPADWLLSTGNGLLNPTPASTWMPTFPNWGVDFDPSNQAHWLGLTDYASVTIANLIRRLSPPLSRLSAQTVGQAAARQSLSFGAKGVDLSVLSRRLLQDIPEQSRLGSGGLIGRVAAPLYFAETLGGSTPSPTQAQQMVTEPFTPAPVTRFLENLLGITPSIPAAAPVISPRAGFGEVGTTPAVVLPRTVGPRRAFRRGGGGALKR